MSHLKDMVEEFVNCYSCYNHVSVLLSEGERIKRSLTFQFFNEVDAILIFNGTISFLLSSNQKFLLDLEFKINKREKKEIFG